LAVGEGVGTFVGVEVGGRVLVGVGKTLGVGLGAGLGFAVAVGATLGLAVGVAIGAVAVRVTEELCVAAVAEVPVSGIAVGVGVVDATSVGVTLGPDCEVKKTTSPVQSVATRASASRPATQMSARTVPGMSIIAVPRYVWLAAGCGLRSRAPGVSLVSAVAPTMKPRGRGAHAPTRRARGRPGIGAVLDTRARRP
jgi:hypothetical protein